MYGVGIIKGLGVTLKHFVDTFVDDIQWFGKKHDVATFQHKQSLANVGLVTVEYPDEKLAVPERFRFVPFLVTYNQDDPQYPGRDWCTSCGICAKVCPPQCIWIVRGNDPTTGRPKPEPEAFYIDIDICMNCGYCAEYCPFDAIKMDHDYELASYDRTSNHIFDKNKLSKEVRYWETIAPTTAAEEMAARGGYDHTDVQKTRKKAGLEASRPGPVSDSPAEAVAAAAPAVAEATPAAVPAAAPAAAPGTTDASGRPTMTPDGKPIVRRRGTAAAAKQEGEGGEPKAAAAPKPRPTPAAAKPAAPAASTAPAAPATPAAPAATTKSAEAEPPAASGGAVQRGPKRVIDPNNPPPVVRRRNPPPNKD
ncbi:MAG TPA: 4Fe-4S binding protein [Aggregatilineales bacterium]|nr:4Fe-4S binding protein [Aggregatilineales bacterium]